MLYSYLIFFIIAMINGINSKFNYDNLKKIICESNSDYYFHSMTSGIV